MRALECGSQQKCIQSSPSPCFRCVPVYCGKGCQLAGSHTCVHVQCFIVHSMYVRMYKCVCVCDHSTKALLVVILVPTNDFVLCDTLCLVCLLFTVPALSLPHRFPPPSPACCSPASSSPMSPHRVSRQASDAPTLVSPKTSWTSPTSSSGSRCCTRWPSSTPPCRRGGSLVPWGGTYPTSSTSPI